MVDLEKYNEIFDEIKLLEEDDIRQLKYNARSSEEKDFYDMLGTYLLKQREEESEMLARVTDILDNNRLIYYFQPIVDASSGDIVAYEALMRTDTEEPVSPLDILKYAKQLDRLPDVEKATFDNVLSYIETHEDLFKNKRIFINSIPGIFIPDEYADEIRERIKSLNRQIVVELTEQMEVDDSELESMKRKIEHLGVDIAIDDYGTGYSNIYNLLRYMPNVVKIDRLLLANIHLNAQKQHFVKEIIEFAHTNDIKVLAEGVENKDELEMLTTLGIDLIQGYYTARPNAEVISEIDGRIQTEIVEFGQYAEQKNRREIYEAGDAANVPLVKIVSVHYSKILFTKDKSCHNTVKIHGQPNFSAYVDIEFEDGYSGRVELCDVDLAIRNELPSIKLGHNCDVTLVLTGDNIIEQGGILVPESSKLTVEGDGNLRIRRIAIDGYGIGNDKNGKCGELVFAHDGLIEIQGNTMHAVGIGAGYGGDIRINSGMFAVKLAGEDAVGIGSLYSDITMSINSCALEFNLRSSVNVGVGSIEGCVELYMSRVGITAFQSARESVCLGTIKGDKFNFKLLHATGEITAHSMNLCGIGNISGDAELDMEHFSFKMEIDGDKAISFGNLNNTASVRSNVGDLIVDVTNTIDFDIGAGKLEIIGGYNEFMHNGTRIKR